MDDGYVSRDEVADRLELAESTVYQHLRELEDAGIVQDDGIECSLTPYGEVVAYRCDSLVRAYDSKALVETAIESEPSMELVLEEFELFPSSEKSPNEPIAEIENRVEEVDEVKGFVPVVLDRYVEFYGGQIEAGLDVEFVVDGGALETLSSSYGDTLEDALSLGLDVHVYDDGLPLGLVLIGEREVGAAVYGDVGGVVGVLVSDSARARTWAEDLYREYLDDAEEFV